MTSRYCCFAYQGIRSSFRGHIVMWCMWSSCSMCIQCTTWTLPHSNLQVLLLFFDCLLLFRGAFKFCWEKIVFLFITDWRKYQLRCNTHVQAPCLVFFHLLLARIKLWPKGHSHPPHLKPATGIDLLFSSECPWQVLWGKKCFVNILEFF